MHARSLALGPPLRIAKLHQWLVQQQQPISACVDLGVSLSAGGSIQHDKAANAKAYGTHVSPDDILSNRVDPPTHMQEFYKELEGLGHICA